MADGHSGTDVSDLWRVLEGMGTLGLALLGAVFGYARVGFSKLSDRLDSQQQKAGDAALGAEQRYASKGDVSALADRLEKHLDQRLEEHRRWITAALENRSPVRSQ